MNSNVTALIVAIVGVAGTLFAALLTQRSYVHTKQLELKDQHEQRQDDERRINLKERREVYIALNAAARDYRRAMKNHLFECTDQTNAELERARREFDRRNAEGQLIAHAEVLKITHTVSTELAETFGQVKRLDTVRRNALLADNHDESEALIAKLNGTVAERIRQLRKVMREDLGVTESA